MKRWIASAWEGHSLTIVLVLLGAILFGVALPLREGTWFDYWLGLGHGCWTGALVNSLAGPFRERNRPDT